MTSERSSNTGKKNASYSSPSRRNTRVANVESDSSKNEDEEVIDGKPSTSITTVTNGEESSHALVGVPVAAVSPFSSSAQRHDTSLRKAAQQQQNKRLLITEESGDEGEDESNSSEESYIDSLEEGRTPLLRDGDADNELDFNNDRHRNNVVNVSRARTPANCRSNYSTAQRVEEADNDGDPMAKRTLRRLPDERYKAFLAGVMLFAAGLFNDVVLSFVHNRLPETKPLPDVIFENTPYWPWALTVSEYLMVTLVATLLILTTFHRHRWILLRRIATIGCLLYFGRCVTMFVTQVPKADPNYYCSPKLAPQNQTFWNIFMRGLRVLSGLGLQVNGDRTLCGDYIYSGHTIVHVTCYLFIREYSPRKWYALHYAAMFLATIGVFCLLTSRGHYTVDVVIAYWIATRVFWEYHTLANISMLRTGQRGRNHLTKPIWFPLFQFMEASVLRPVPRKYAAPFRLPFFST